MTALDMNPEIRAQWVAALRSGKYRQGNRLRTQDDEFCCLGVLCDLAQKAGVVQAALNEGEWAYGNEFTELPDEVMKWAGLGSANPEQPPGADGTDTLAGRNDEGYTFAQIADLIEGRRTA